MPAGTSTFNAPFGNEEMTIFKRILFTVLGATISCGTMIVACIVVERVLGGGCAGMAFAYIPLLILLADLSLCGGSFLSGVLQPSTNHPNLLCFLCSPGVYLSVLWLILSGTLSGLTLGGLFLWLVIPIVISWGGCRAGVALRHRFVKTKAIEQAEAS